MSGAGWIVCCVPEVQPNPAAGAPGIPHEAKTRAGAKNMNFQKGCLCLETPESAIEPNTRNRVCDHVSLKKRPGRSPSAAKHAQNLSGCERDDPRLAGLFGVIFFPPRREHLASDATGSSPRAPGGAV